MVWIASLLYEILKFKQTDFSAAGGICQAVLKFK